MSKGIFGKKIWMLIIVMVISLTSGVMVAGQQEFNKQSKPKLTKDKGKTILEFHETGTLYPIDSKAISSYIIEPEIDKVLIKKGVELKGGFIIRDRSKEITIEGEGEKEKENMSVIEGFTRGKKGVPDIGASVDKRLRYCNISSLVDRKTKKEGFAKYTVKLKNFISRNPAFYNVNFEKKQKVIADGIHIEDTEHNINANMDGILGGEGSEIKNCNINTSDDAIKCYYGNYLIENTTITHNSNGAPIQFGWDNSTTDKNTVTIDNVTIKSNAKTYNQGIFSWAGGDKMLDATVDLKIKGLKLITNKGMKAAHLVQFGAQGPVSNKTINFTGVGVDKLDLDSVKQVKGSSNNIVK